MSVPHLGVPSKRGLFDEEAPNGFEYREDFITPEEEVRLAEEIARVEFSTFTMRGVVARRRVAFFGRPYDEATAVVDPLPAFLMPARDRLARWADVDPNSFEMAVINEYFPGAPIGWHRDAPQYGIVAGVSLLSSCRMKFRPYAFPFAPESFRGRSPSLPRRSGAKAGPRRRATHEVTLERRSAYLMTGDSRHLYEHHIPAVAALRYSVTFRTPRF